MGKEDFDEEDFFRKMKLLTLVSALFLVIGVAFQATALTLEFTEFAPMLDEYYGDYSKAERDAAQPGSELSELQAEIKKFPPKLLTLKLVGIGSILTGIFILLFVIVQALKIMPVRLSDVIT